MRRQLESEVLEKLWRMGVLKQSREQGAGLSRVERDVTVSAFCRRRLGVLMVRSGMVENIKAVCVSLSLSLFMCYFCFSLREQGLTLIGDYVHRTRPCPCWHGGRHRSGFPGHAEYGGLRDLGGQQQD